MSNYGRPTSRGERESKRRPEPMVDVASPSVEAARRLWSEGRYADAFLLLREATRQEPNNVRTYVAAARAHAEVFDLEKMERVHETLIRRAPRHPGVHHYIGETFGLLKLPERAIASYERASALPGAGPPTWMELAYWYERAHRLDEAEEMIERTISAGFDLPLVWLVRGRIHRRRNRNEEAKATFLELIQRLPENSEWACQAWGELTLIKDGEGDADGALDAVEHCKRAQRTREHSYWHAAQRTASQMCELIDVISRDDLRRWRRDCSGLDQHRVALLTGFPRSGTTLLEQMLDAHPDLVSSEERDYIGRELMRVITSGRATESRLDLLKELSSHEINVQRQRYLHAMEQFLGEPIGGRMHLDKNPTYNLMIPFMLRVFPESRIVAALRDPRDVVLSCYLRYLPLNAFSVSSLDIQRLAERYALDMTAWLKLRELLEVPWCEVRYEDVVTDLESAVRRALDTLGLSWDAQVLDYRDRLSKQKQVTSPTYEAVTKSLYTDSIGRWKKYERLLEPALKTLEPFVREFGYRT